MKRLTLAVCLSLAAVVPAASAKAPTRQHVRSYERAYHQVAAKFGTRAPGRNIVKYGLPHGPASDARVVVSLGVLYRMLAPPPVMAAPVATIAAPVTYTGSYSGGSMPTCTWAPESGGNYRAVNPSSGAGGKYQIIPSTWAANGGTGAPQDASPAEQDRVAHNILQSQGLGAWVNC